jgi:hypothetical protein
MMCSKTIYLFVFFLLGASLVSEFYVPTFRNTLSVASSQVAFVFHTTYEEGKQCSETSGNKIQTPGKHPTFRTRRKFEIRNLTFLCIWSSQLYLLYGALHMSFILLLFRPSYVQIFCPETCSLSSPPPLPVQKGQSCSKGKVYPFCHLHVTIVWIVKVVRPSPPPLFRFLISFPLFVLFCSKEC